MRALLAILALIALAGCLRSISDGLGGNDAEPWTQPPLGEATIRPGNALGTGSCTTNFLFLDSDGHTVYIGTAAHCVQQSSGDLLDNTNTNGCESVVRPHEPETVEVPLEGAQHRAVLAYSSWWTMQAVGEANVATCANNDFALLRLHPDDAAKAHPALLTFGGPTSIAEDEAIGDLVLTHGATSLRPGIDELDARRGIITATSAWSHDTMQITPGLPGDSGSAVIRDDGAAIGILVTVGLSPLPSNGITDLGRAVDYANSVGGMDVQLLTAPLS